MSEEEEERLEELKRRAIEAFEAARKRRLRGEYVSLFSRRVRKA